MSSSDVIIVEIPSDVVFVDLPVERPLCGVGYGPPGPEGPPGPPGSPGTVLPPGGTTGQVLTKASGTDGDADWQDPSGGVTSVNGQIGDVVLDFADPGNNADITSLSGVTGGIQAPDYITFDTTPETVPTAPGSLYWDSADGNQTLSLVMANGDAVQQIGEEQYYRIKASSAIADGQVVMFSGTVGASGALTGAPAAGLTASTASYVMGIATQSMAHNAWGYVTSFGLVRQVNTSAWPAGTILYYDPTVAGGLTSTVPAAPNAKVQVCAVIYQHASNGSLFVRPSFGGALGQYEGDVQITSPLTGDALVWNGVTSRWENKPISVSPGGSDTQIQFNDGGAFGGDAGLTFNRTTGSLTLGGKTVTTSNPVFNASQTWNAAGVTFTGLQFNVTDTASNAASLLLDLQVGGVSKINVSKSGRINFQNNASFYIDSQISATYQIFTLTAGSASLVIRPDQGISSSVGYGFRLSGSAPDLLLYRDAAQTLAQRNGTNAQTFRLYNTYTDASNYERGYMRWNANVLEIGAESAGTGTARSVLLQSSGTAANITVQANTATTTATLRHAYSGAAVTVYGTASGQNNVSLAAGSDGVTIDNGLLLGSRNSTPVVTFTIKADTNLTRNRVGSNLQLFGGDSITGTNNNGGPIYLDGGTGFGTGVHGNIIVGSTRGALVTAPKTFADLPTKSNGARSFVTDGTVVTSVFGTQVTAGGSTYNGPVWSDGTNWYIG